MKPYEPSGSRRGTLKQWLYTPGDRVRCPVDTSRSEFFSLGIFPRFISSAESVGVILMGLELGPKRRVLLTGLKPRPSRGRTTGVHFGKAGGSCGNAPQLSLGRGTRGAEAGRVALARQEVSFRCKEVSSIKL